MKHTQMLAVQQFRDDVGVLYHVSQSFKSALAWMEQTVVPHVISVDGVRILNPAITQSIIDAEVGEQLQSFQRIEADTLSFFVSLVDQTLKVLDTLSTRVVMVNVSGAGGTGNVLTENVSPIMRFVRVCTFLAVCANRLGEDVERMIGQGVVAIVPPSEPNLSPTYKMLIDEASLHYNDTDARPHSMFEGFSVVQLGEVIALIMLQLAAINTPDVDKKLIVMCGQNASGRTYPM